MKHFFTTLIFIALSMKTILAGDISDALQLELLKGWRDSNGTHYGGLKIILSPGWKTYWKQPGEAGFIPQFDWNGSKNLSAVKVLWPHPEIFNDNGLQSFGYKTSVILPIEFTPHDVTQLIQPKVKITLGICDKLCVPVSRELSVKLRTSKTMVDSEIIKYLNRLPKLALKAEVKHITCEVEVNDENLIFRSNIELSSKNLDIKAITVELPESDLWFKLPTFKKIYNSLEIFTEIQNFGNGPFILDRNEIIITLIKSSDSIYLKGC